MLMEKCLQGSSIARYMEHKTLELIQLESLMSSNKNGQVHMGTCTWAGGMFSRGPEHLKIITFSPALKHTCYLGRTKSSILFKGSTLKVHVPNGF